MDHFLGAAGPLGAVDAAGLELGVVVAAETHGQQQASAGQEVQGGELTGVRVQENGLVRAEMESGKRVTGDALLYTVGRQSNADQLQLDRIGIEPDPRGRIPVNENFQTTRPHVYAVGDCIGFPALASTSMEQGRLASTHMFDGPSLKSAPFFPYGIYTVPEISMVRQDGKVAAYDAFNKISGAAVGTRRAFLP